MLLSELIDDEYLSQVLPQDLNREITGICSDSRKVKPGDIFVAVQGAQGHGGPFVQKACQEGAVAIILDRDGESLFQPQRMCVIRVEDTGRYLPRLLERFYGRVSDSINLLGVTGTNGKTTITYLLESILTAAGVACGVIGTVNYRFGKKVLPAGNTTPGLVDLYQYLQEMSRAGMSYCVMEVSSHALAQGRVAGLGFRAAIFTNLTAEHLDYHQDLETYFEAKSRLFTGLSAGDLAVINLDDPYGRRLLELTPARRLTYGIDQAADMTARDIESGMSGSSFVVNFQGQQFALKTGLCGRHNVLNIMAAVCLGLTAGVPVDRVQQGVAALKSVPGRMESVETGRDFHVFIDYAHTPDALQNVLTGIHQFKTGRVITVFGCGGDRDKGKRPQMGEIVSHLADFAFITNDNPRGEDPQLIAQEIIRGFSGRHYEVVLDRRSAIARALKMAQPGDIVLVAGKGHEDYQIFREKVVPFKERTVIEELLVSKENI